MRKDRWKRQRGREGWVGAGEKEGGGGRDGGPVVIC